MSGVAAEAAEAAAAHCSTFAMYSASSSAEKNEAGGTVTLRDKGNLIFSAICSYRVRTLSSCGSSASAAPTAGMAAAPLLPAQMPVVMAVGISPSSQVL